MPGYPKPEKKERGNTKDAHERRRSAPQWKGHEREDARWLQNTYGEDGDPIFRAAKTSTGRVGHIVSLGYDSTSAHAIGESKDHKLPKWLVELWITANQSGAVIEEVKLPTWIRDAWAQINQAARTRVTKRRPVLFLSYGKDQNPTFLLEGKQTKLPEMHIIDREHHTELIKGWLGLEGVRSVLFGQDAEKITDKETIRAIRQIVEDTL